MRKRRDTSRSTERKVEESKEKEEGIKMKEEIEEKLKEYGERIQKNTTDALQQFMEMMQREKQQERQERAEKEAKDREEKERRRMQKEEEKQYDKQQKEKRRKEKEEEKLLEKRDMMQRFESLEKRILDSEVNFHKKIESMIKRNTEQIENKLVDSKKEMETRMDIQDIHIKGIKEKIDQDNLEVEKSIGTIEGKLKEVKMEQINQQQKLNKVQQEMGNMRQSTGIENVHTGRTEAATQVEIYYGDMRVSPCKQTNNVQRHLQEIQQINKEAEEDEIRSNIPHTFKRMVEISSHNNKEQYTNGMKFEETFSNQFWGMLECEEQYPLLEGKTNENYEIQEQQKAVIRGNNQLKQIGSNITTNELCKRNKRWKWSQQSHNASVKRKGRSYEI